MPRSHAPASPCPPTALSATGARQIRARATPSATPGPEVYRDPTTGNWELYQLAEKLVDIDDALATWRHKHVLTVSRVIGGKKGHRRHRRRALSRIDPRQARLSGAVVAPHRPVMGSSAIVLLRKQEPRAASRSPTLGSCFRRSTRHELQAPVPAGDRRGARAAALRRALAPSLARCILSRPARRVGGRRAPRRPQMGARDGRDLARRAGVMSRPSWGCPILRRSCSRPTRTNCCCGSPPRCPGGRCAS
jgi:hypothetical protein